MSKGKTCKDIIEVRIGRQMTETEINKFNNMFATAPTEEQTIAFANTLVKIEISPLDELKQKEMKKLEKEFQERRKDKEKLDKAKLLEMEEKEKAAKAKRQIAEDLYGEIDRHKEIRARWEVIDRELRDLEFASSYIKDREQRIKSLKEEKKQLREEYIVKPFVYPAKTFSIVTKYVSGDIELILEDGVWKFYYKNAPFKYDLIKDRDGTPIALETSISNYTLSNMFDSAFYGQKIRTPIKFSPKLETDKPKENITKSTEPEKKGLLEKVKQKLS